MSLLELFCDVDDFWLNSSPIGRRMLLSSRDEATNPQDQLE